jgi:hypothetical protein
VSHHPAIVYLLTIKNVRKGPVALFNSWPSLYPALFSLLVKSLVPVLKETFLTGLVSARMKDPDQAERGFQKPSTSSLLFYIFYLSQSTLEFNPFSNFAQIPLVALSVNMIH